MLRVKTRLTEGSTGAGDSGDPKAPPSTGL